MEDRVRRHAKLAISMYERGLKLARRGDAVQASEKLYKAVEEGIKALAIAKDTEEARKALKRRGWSTRLLGLAAIKLGPTAFNAWAHAYYLHVEGFHEARLGMEELNASIPMIEPLIQEVRKLLDQGP